MKKYALTLLLMMTPLSFLFSQTFDNLWKQVDEAQKHDLPKTEAGVLEKIASKAEHEKAYGHLLKAHLGLARVKALVSSDSLQPAVERLEARAQTVADVALKAVYHTVLGYIYDHNRQLSDDAGLRSARYYELAMAQPDVLAQTKATAYVPLVVKGEDSRLFGDDLLSLIGYETGRFQAMHQYYLTTSNRVAQLLTAIEQWRADRQPDKVGRNTGIASSADNIHASTLATLDSIIDSYADLPECGEAAIARYEYMEHWTQPSAQAKVEYIDQALSRWPSWKRMELLRNYRKTLTQPQFQAESSHEVLIPNQPQTIRLNNLRGINAMTMRIYSARLDGDTPYHNVNMSRNYDKVKSLLTLLPQHTQTRQYAPHADYELFDDSLQLPPLPVGIYLVELESTPGTEVARQLYFVSNLRLLTLPLPGNRLRLVAVDATTGQPVGGANVRITNNRYNMKQTAVNMTTDDKGECIYTYKEDRHNCEFFVTKGNDRACRPHNHWGRYNQPSTPAKQTDYVLYTDRAIYRPGQTVHVGAIVFSTHEGHQHQAEAKKAVKLTLRDANWQEVATADVVTDDYGTATTDFVLPAGQLNGRFTIQAGNGHSMGISVEEYKRPTFEVEFQPATTDYKAGDTITVRATARTYAGVPVAGARVSYKVERRRAYWWLSYSSYWRSGLIGKSSDRDVLASGEAITQDDGTFTVDMPLQLPITPYTMFYQFVATATVTDQGDESHEAQLLLPLGNRATALSTTLPSTVQREAMPALTIHLRNAAGNDIRAQVSYQIDNGQWTSATTDTELQLPASLRSGEHVLRVQCPQDTLEQKFIVFSENDERPAATTDDWFWASARQFDNDGRPVTVQVGSSDSNIHIVYTITDGHGNIVESGAADKTNELINRKFRYNASYGNGLSMAFAWVKKGKVYVHQLGLQRPLPDKQLHLKWQTMRNRLQPGQKEEWTLNVEQPDGRPATAQLMATLYDKSLDQLVEHGWLLRPEVYLPLETVTWGYGTWDELYWQGTRRQTLANVGDLLLSAFDHDCYPNYWMGRNRNIRIRGIMLRKGQALYANAAAEEALPTMAAIGASDMADAEMSKTREIAVGAQKASDESEDDNGHQSTTDTQQPSLRTNLQETAFFYPQLQADANGRVAIKFTLPESLTTWRFLGVAHTPDMMYGTIESEAVAQKDLMVQPNMPRFLRVGDQAVLTARIVNMGQQDEQVTARLQLLDPETEKVLFEQEKRLGVAQSATTSAAFSIDCSAMEQQLLVCRWTVTGSRHSDGEQHYLPILPDRERVTVTRPFTQNEPGTEQIDLTEMVPANAANASLTIEYTNNPAWLVLQALPTLAQTTDDNAVSQAAALYANLIGMHIVGQNPQMRDVMEQWKCEQGSETSMQSNLQKDQELKDLLLQETPWVTEARNEAEQKHLLSTFFDTNIMDRRIETAAAKLGRLQNSDGSWSWWKGMHPSLFMTVGISEMLVRLNKMVGKQETTADMLTKAFSYMGKEMVELVDEMKRQQKKGVKPSFPSHLALEWLYTCTLDGRQLPREVTKANDYLKALLKKDVKNQTIYEKALSAIVLRDASYVRSLKEWTVYKEEMGRYYDTQRASYSWRNYRIPTQVAAIEALQLLDSSDRQTIEQMQRWLLQEKRTTSWETPLSSVDAIYAFLNGRSHLLAPQPEAVLSIDREPLNTPRATAGIGYVKTNIAATGAKLFEAEKKSEGTSWGTVYAQFMQTTTDIQSQASGISVKRELTAVETATEQAQPSVPHRQPALNPGSKVKVRITIEADRDYDFVQVQDRRAACLEPAGQLSGYHWGYYCSPKDCTTNYYFDRMAKGKHVIETEYFIDREGDYQTGTCTVQCAYAPEFHGLAPAITINVNKSK